MAGWDTGRPIYDRLPAESGAYQGNAVVDAVTRPFDNLLMDWRDLVINFEANFLNPATCQSGALDWLAQLCGFTGEYWDASWGEVQKRELISKSHLFIWPNKGTQILLEYLFDVFLINATVYQVNQFVVGVSPVGAPIGGELLKSWILMPIEYRRTGEEWALVQRFVRLYTPCFAEFLICYDHWYAGFSAVGDPIL